MNQNYRANLVNIVDADTGEFSALTAGHNFYGGGPSVSWEGAWRIGGSPLSVFASVRGCFLVGTSRQTAVFSETIVDPDVEVAQANIATNDSRDTPSLPIVELEGGFEYPAPWADPRVLPRAVVNHTYSTPAALRPRRQPEPVRHPDVGRRQLLKR